MQREISGERAARRDHLFREPVASRIARVTLGAAYAMKPERIAALPALARMLAADTFSRSGALPNPDAPYENKFGLCGIVNDLSPRTLLAAYRLGLFPGGHVAPLKWFSPPERCVLFFNEMKIEKSVRRLLRKNSYTVSFDRDFEGVIKACSEKRAGKWGVTWISPRIMRAYAGLHDLGFAHSYEVWNEAGELAGGGYGVAIGGVFFGESQFSRESNTSKLGQAVLSWHLAKWGFHFDDSKWSSPMLTNMGFRSIPRDEFRSRLALAQRVPVCASWEIETELHSIAAWKPNELPATAAVSMRPAEVRENALKPRRAMVPFFPALDQSTVGFAETLLAII